MGWFKSAEEKAAEKRREELIEKYGEKDGLRIYENKISEEKYLKEKEKEKKETAQKKVEAKKQKVLDIYNNSENDSSIPIARIFFENNPDKDDYKLHLHTSEKYKEFSMSYKKFVQLTKELIEEGKLFTTDTWKGEALPDWEMYKKGSYISVFTKSHAEECIAEEKEKQKEDQKWKNLIIDLLTKKSIKMTISDITAHIKHDNRNYVKSLLEEMHKDEDIDFAGSGRYFIYSEEKKSSKKASTKKADPTAEIRKYAKLRDDGLITEEEYQAKKKEILGL